MALSHHTSSFLGSQAGLGGGVPLRLDTPWSIGSTSVSPLCWQEMEGCYVAGLSVHSACISCLSRSWGTWQLTGGVFSQSSPNFFQSVLKGGLVAELGVWEARPGSK